MYVLFRNGTLLIIQLETFEKIGQVKNINIFDKIIIDVPLKAENFIAWSQPISGAISLSSINSLL